MTESLLKLLFVIIFIGIASILIKTIFGTLDKTTRHYRSRSSFHQEAEIIEKELKNQVKKKTEMLEKVSKYTKKNPGDTASLLNNWLVEDEKN